MAKDEGVIIGSKLLGKPQVKAIARILNIDIDLVSGKLTRFWLFAIKNSTDGLLRNMTPSVIDQIVGCNGFAEAYATVGWAEVIEDGYKIEGWDIHLSEAARERRLNAERQQRYRDEKKKAKASNSNAFGVTSNEKNVTHNADTVTDANDVIPKPPTTEVKPRKKRNPDQPEHLWGTGEVLLDSLTGEWLGIETSVIDIWKKTCPAVNVEFEMRKASMWCIGNKQRGRKSDYKKFLTGWLQRCQDRGGNSPSELGGNFGPHTPPRQESKRPSLFETQQDRMFREIKEACDE